MPLDDRPCNRLFPRQLTDIAGWRLAMPPRDSLGWFTRPGDCQTLLAWLHACPGPRLVLSLDMLCYGGLIASRTPQISPDLALERLNALRALRRKRPELKIFAFSVITRLGTTVAFSSDQAVHENLRAYSQLVDRVERLGQENARQELASVLTRLDGEVLQNYLGVRRRNHAINREALRLLAEGVLDYLILAQEDASSIGLHIPEQKALRAQIDEFRLNDRVSLHPGADEVGLVLATRHCLSEASFSPRLSVEYATREGAEVIPLFEYQPLRQTLADQIKAAGAHLAPADEADSVLFVHTPIPHPDGKADEFPQTNNPTLAQQAERLVGHLCTAKAVGGMVGLADLAYCNGADPELFAALRKVGALQHLDAFAAWNTAANTIGTAVSQLCLNSLASSEPALSPPARSTRFTACRLIDDLGYQSRVRQQAIDKAHVLGADPYSLGDRWHDLETYVVHELSPFAYTICSDFQLSDFSISLPWPRLFEIEVI